MAMTRLERGTKYAIAKILNQQGYPRYADFFMKFDLHFHNPKYPFIASIDVENGIINLNPNLTDRNSVSVIIRHEILHAYLNHAKRALNHYAKLKGLQWKDLDDIPLEALVNMSDEELNQLSDGIKQDVITDRQIARDLYGRKYKGYPYHNYIKDLEISNRGYTEKDKNLIRNLTINGVPMGGLITDDLEPSWVDMSIEEMMDVVEKQLKDELKQAEEDAKNHIVRGKFNPRTGRFKSRQGVIYGKA